MTQAYIITEGNQDIIILKRLLPQSIIQEIKFIDGSGQYGARSLASTILVARSIPVALVTDADTEDDSLVSEQLDALNYLLSQASPGIPFKVLLAVPEIEIILLQNRPLIEKLAKRSFTDLEWQLAQSKPKMFLEAVLSKDTPVIHKILTSASDDEIQTLQQYPLIQDLINFLSSVAVTPIV
ncbi:MULTISPECIES: hypothetical protein [unclassified Nostoc]|uniref:hypothetical protein n=1 Tax=unclassified Nostoc TaxID=2593658 RepID=UPI002AD53388|nr:hypothetical protein [Nostoc sp. DedQUE03]MDZ7972500.1 hypothetical protein [Nostoc sp. DedQUE03]MDZ8044700.1 hypothetical protein [Nostoc sp. DedQUE02]